MGPIFYNTLTVNFQIFTDKKKARFQDLEEIHINQNGTEKDSLEGLKMESSGQKETGIAKNDPEKNLLGRLKKDGTDMRNNRERSKREKLVEKSILNG